MRDGVGTGWFWLFMLEMMKESYEEGRRVFFFFGCFGQGWLWTAILDERFMKDGIGSAVMVWNV